MKGNWNPYDNHSFPMKECLPSLSIQIIVEINSFFHLIYEVQIAFKVIYGPFALVRMFYSSQVHIQSFIFYLIRYAQFCCTFETAQQ